MKLHLCFVVLLFTNISLAQDHNLWKKSSGSRAVTKKNLPLKHVVDLDRKSLESVLASAPKRNSKVSSKSIISLPDGNGKMERFAIYENSVMAPELAAKYPEIKSYIGIGIDNKSAKAYFSNSPLGFKSMTLYSNKSAVFIEPVTDDLNTYSAYKKSDKAPVEEKFECKTKHDDKYSTLNYRYKDRFQSSLASLFMRLMVREVNAGGGADDGKLRTFRLAMSTTAEYAAYFGGTKAGALAAMNNTLTRVNGIFEKDLGVRLILIANNDALIYTNASTDPYSDAVNYPNWKTENQTMLTAVVGEANYDIGHLLGAGVANSGDAGCRGCVCNDGAKGRAYTSASSSNYQGDTFDLDFVAHEMGHQLGANHTFTHTNEGTIAQLEPGSGITLMSYSGRTTKDIQSDSEAFYHAISIQQITDIIKTKTCPVVTSTGNAIPVVNAGSDYVIPKGTPFMLTGSAVDANTDDILTYGWEQMDLGNATTTVPSPANISGPLFRSYLATSSPIRYFPNMTSILAGSTTTQGREIISEALPGVARALNFRLTVRDNRIGGGANNTDDVVLTVDANSGPFTVDSQNSAVSYPVSSSQVINWSVAGTNANGVNCASVDILLSTNGGQSFPIVLASATPNDGSQSIVIPNIPGTNNRIMVKGSNHIFFDVNNASFTIDSSSADTMAPTSPALSSSGLTYSSVNLSWSGSTDNVGVVGYDVYQNGVFKASVVGTSLAVSGLSPSTTYSFYVRAKDAAGNVSASSNPVSVITPAAPDIIAPSAPVLSSSGLTSSSVNLSWSLSTDNVGVVGYNVYQNGVLKSSVAGTSLAISGLSPSTAYSFYVRAKDAAGNLSANSNIVSVTTLSLADVTPPSASVLSAFGTTKTTTNLSWSASSDNVGVIGYNIYQNGVFKASITGTSYIVTGLMGNKTYTFSVKAKDAAGNVSASSNVVSVKTPRK